MLGKSNIVDLYEIKASRMDDETLRSEIAIHLTALGGSMLTPETKHRTMILLKEGMKRTSMSANHNDFSITIRILSHL